MTALLKLLTNKYVKGAVGLLLGLVAIWAYGKYQHGVGYAERDMKARLELGARQTALYNEQTRLENERYANDLYVQQLKADSILGVTNLNAIVEQLRGHLFAAGGQHTSSSTGGRIDGGDPDWIGIIGTCWGDYAELGKEAAGYADRVNGLQDYVRRIQGGKFDAKAQ